MENKSVIILAGGKSSRMGQNKAFLMINNIPIIEQLVSNMKLVAEEIIIVCNEPELYQDINAKIITDEIKGKGPLGGIYTGLKASRSWLNFIVACDMPFVETNLVNYMFKEAPNFDVVVPKINGYLEPLHAIYSKGCIEPIENCIKRGNFKLVAFYPEVRVKYLTEEKLLDFTSHRKVFYNINTQEDFKKALNLKKVGGEIGEESTS